MSTPILSSLISHRTESFSLLYYRMILSLISERLNYISIEAYETYGLTRAVLFLVNLLANLAVFDRQRGAGLCVRGLPAARLGHDLASLHDPRPVQLLQLVVHFLVAHVVIDLRGVVQLHELIYEFRSAGTVCPDCAGWDPAL